MSLQDYSTNFIAYTTKSCFELLFIHEIVVSRLLCAESPREKLNMTNLSLDAVKQRTNVTLKRILAAYKNVPEDQISDDVLHSSKVQPLHSISLLH
jgi:hypothetical protein